MALLHSICIAYSAALYWLWACFSVDPESCPGLLCQRQRQLSSRMDPVELSGVKWCKKKFTKPKLSKHETETLSTRSPSPLFVLSLTLNPTQTQVYFPQPLPQTQPVQSRTWVQLDRTKVFWARHSLSSLAISSEIIGLQLCHVNWNKLKWHYYCHVMSCHVVSSWVNYSWALAIHTIVFPQQEYCLAIIITWFLNEVTDGGLDWIGLEFGCSGNFIICELEYVYSLPSQVQVYWIKWVNVNIKQKL